MSVDPAGNVDSALRGIERVLGMATAIDGRGRGGVVMSLADPVPDALASALSSLLGRGGVSVAVSPSRATWYVYLDGRLAWCGSFVGDPAVDEAARYIADRMGAATLSAADGAR